MLSRRILSAVIVLFSIAVFSVRSMGQQYVIYILDQNGRPIPNAKILTPSANEIFASNEGKVVYEGEIDYVWKNGKYVPVRSFRDPITVKAGDYHPQTIELEEYPPGTVNVKLTPKPRVDEPLIPLIVYVKNKKNEPISGAMVSVGPGRSAVTGDRGYAEAGHRQQPGEYVRVLVQAAGYKDQEKRILVGVGQGSGFERKRDKVVFILEEGENERNVSTIVVEVLDYKTEMPVKGADVKLNLSDGSEYNARTSVQGEATLSDEQGFAGTSGRVTVKHTDYDEKWSDIAEELMTANDESVRRFVVYVKKKTAGVGRWNLVSVTVIPEDPSKVWPDKPWTYNAQSPSAHYSIYNGDYQVDYNWTPPPQQFDSSGFTVSLNVRGTQAKGATIAQLIGVSGSGIDSDTPNDFEHRNAYAHGTGSVSAQKSVTFKPQANADEIEVRIGLSWGSVTFYYKYKRANK